MPPRPYLLSSKTTAKGRESITRLSQTSGPPALAGGGSREVTRWKPLRGPSRHATKPLSFAGERAVPSRMHGVVPVMADARRCGPSGPANTEAVTWLILPVVICLSQRLSHASVSTSTHVKRNCEWLIKSVVVHLIVPVTRITVAILELIHANER